MSFVDIVTIPNPVLRTACDIIDDLSKPNVKKLVEDLLETVDYEGRAGLAANQIGVNLKAFSWSVGSIDYIINPVIVEQKGGFQETEEGCLSIPDLFYTTKRYNYTRVEGVDLDGKKKVVEGEGLMAKCLQHEMGHMEGQLYIDTLLGDERKKAFRQLRSRL